MAAALSANRAYLGLLMQSLANGRKMTFDDFIRFRREAEMTNNNAFVCLRRMENEPRNEKKDLEQFFIIAGHNIRLTRLINALSQHLRDHKGGVNMPAAAAFNTFMRGMLDHMEDALKAPGGAPSVDSAAGSLAAEVKKILGADGKGEDEIAHDLMERMARETIGMYHFVRQFTVQPAPVPAR
jgi:uncharacterized membrane protein YccC